MTGMIQEAGLLDLCRLLYEAPSQERLDEAMIAARVHFNCLAVGHRLSTYQPMVLRRPRRTEQLTSKYGWPADFMADWIKRGLAQDFAVNQLHITETPVCAWNLAEQMAALHGPMTGSAEFMLAHGICSGISVMVPRTHGDVGSIILVYDRARASRSGDVAKEFAAELFYLGNAVVRALEMLEPGAVTVSLSSHQIACLRWIKAGKTDEEVAEITDCSVNTVRYHLKSVMKALGAANRTHAVVLAMEARLI